jgi:hypothetical protein
VGPQRLDLGFFNNLPPAVNLPDRLMTKVDIRVVRVAGFFRGSQKFDGFFFAKKAESAENGTVDHKPVCALTNATLGGLQSADDHGEDASKDFDGEDLIHLDFVSR